MSLLLAIFFCCTFSLSFSSLLVRHLDTTFPHCLCLLHEIKVNALSSLSFRDQNSLSTRIFSSALSVSVPARLFSLSFLNRNACPPLCLLFPLLSMKPIPALSLFAKLFRYLPVSLWCFLSPLFSFFPPWTEIIAHRFFYSAHIIVIHTLSHPLASLYLFYSFSSVDKWCVFFYYFSLLQIFSFLDPVLFFF